MSEDRVCRDGLSREQNGVVYSPKELVILMLRSFLYYDNNVSSPTDYLLHQSLAVYRTIAPQVVFEETLA